MIFLWILSFSTTYILHLPMMESVREWRGMWSCLSAGRPSYEGGLASSAVSSLTSQFWEHALSAYQNYYTLENKIQDNY